MFKIIVAVLSLATQQPVGFAVSDGVWPTEKECSEHLIGALAETAQALKGQAVTFKGKCVNAKLLDKMLARVKQQQQKQNPNSISVEGERVD